MDAEYISSQLSQYIRNNLPINLIYVPQMKLMDRQDITRHTQRIVEAMERRVSQAAETATRASGASSSASVSSESRKVSTRRTIDKIIQRHLSYAILSHRWLQWGAEVTYQEMLAYTHDTHDTGAARLPNVGLWKLKKLCEMARRYKCDWAWADTCCINQQSSAELNESIRSMYRWYSNAQICLVHLGDTITRADMGADVWFTRGWTLQELLAPKTVKFVNKEWEPLLPKQDNDKRDIDLMEDISKITGIPTSDLQEFSPSTDRIREKMAWTANRQTTRVEDAAYSLVGIFNVTLVTAYGESERAFYRLQLEIMGHTDSIDIFVWDGQQSKNHSMLAAGPACFRPIAREDAFSRLIHPMPKRSKSQCEQDARKLIPRGSQTFSMANSALRMEMVVYDFSAGEPYGRDFDGWPDWILRLNDEMQGDLKLGVLDYERDDAHGRPDAAVTRVVVPEAMQNYWLQNASVRGDTEDRSLILAETQRSILEARAKRLYTAVLLRPDKLRRYNLVRIAERGLIQISRPHTGWKIPETVYLL